MATIRDVARRAGVSAASVSRVLKNDTTFSVSQKTRERILEAAGELGYNKCFEYSAIQGTRGTIHSDITVTRSSTQSTERHWKR